MTPKILDIVKDVEHHLTEPQRKSIQKLTEILSGWKGTFEKESVAATVYMRFHIQFLRNLFYKYAPDDEAQRFAFSDSYHFTDTYQILLTDVHELKDQSHYQVLCDSTYENFSGRNFCAYNVAMALVQTDDWLSSKVSKDSSKWLWGDLHINEYPNQPWSKTPLKFIFDRHVNTIGNDNTPNYSKTSVRMNADNTVIRSTASAGLKILIEFAKDPEDDRSFFSIDTGMNGNLFSGNYFDLNKDHL